jgi:integrase
MTTLVDVIFVDSLDAGSIPATSTKCGQRRTLPNDKSPEKSGLLFFYLFVWVRRGMYKSVSLGVSEAKDTPNKNSVPLKGGGRMPRRVLPLTDKHVSNAKAKAKEYKLFDGGGLFLLIPEQKYDSKGKALPASKLWRLKYRIGGKEKLLALGSYDEVSLADARKGREDARKLIDKNIDPSEVKKAKKAADLLAGENSFEVVAREWLASKQEWSDSHAETTMGRLKLDVFPVIGTRAIGEIEAPELLAMLRRVESRGAVETAHRLRSICSQILRYAIGTGRAKRDWAADLIGILPSCTKGHHAAITDPREMGPLLRTIDGYKGTIVVRSALLLSPLVFVRPGELRYAEWAEFDLEGEVWDYPMWDIPADRMKGEVGHLVPLSRQALTILKELKTYTGRGKYVFPGARSATRVMSENTVNSALRYMGFDKDTMTGHGFRATARTMLRERLDVLPEYIELQLAHVTRSQNGSAYDRVQFIAKRREMLQIWADYLDELKAGAKLIPFGKAG